MPYFNGAILPKKCCLKCWFWRRMKRGNGDIEGCLLKVRVQTHCEVCSCSDENNLVPLYVWCRETALKSKKVYKCFVQDWLRIFLYDHTAMKFEPTATYFANEHSYIDCYYHVTYAFHSESTLYSFLNVNCLNSLFKRGVISEV